MARIIPLPPNQHEHVQSLLPWYVTGKLDPSESARVEAHLADCPLCRREAEAERRLDAEVAGLSLDVEHSWARLRGRIVAGSARRTAGPRSVWAAELLGRRGVLRWTVALQALVIMGLVAAMASDVRAPARYRALGTPRPALGGDAIAVFRPEAKEAGLRQALNAADARIVDGPTAADAYVLAIPTAELQSALTRLRQNPDVLMVEPVDAGAQR